MAIFPEAIRSPIRRLFRLRKFSEEVADRVTGRIEYSMALYQGLQSSGRVLNIGSSIGWFEKLVEGRVGSDVVGLEYDAAKLQQARKNAPSANFIEGSVLSMPFGDGAFDTVVMLEVLEHIPINTEEDALCEIRRVLRKGGRFLFSTPNKNVLSCVLDPAWYLGHRHYLPDALVKLFRRVGFRVDLCVVRGGLWELISMNLHYLFKLCLYAETPCLAFWERKRSSEYMSSGNRLATIFITATAV